VDACNTKLINVALPTLAADAASKGYVDLGIQTFVGRFLPLTGGSLSGNLLVGSNTLSSVQGLFQVKEILVL